MQSFMNNTRKKHNRITKNNRIQKRRYNRITITTVVTTALVLVTSITVIAAPMKQNNPEAARKVTLPGAGINKVVSDYAEIADETEISNLADSSVKNSAKAEKGTTLAALKEAVQKVVETAELQSETETYAEEPVYAEADYEEESFDETYEEPVYEEYVEEPYYEEEIYYEPETFLDEVFYEEPEEEPVYEEDPDYEPEYEEETWEEYVAEQEENWEEPAEQTAEETKPPKESNASLGQTIANDACQYVGWLPYVWAGASLETGADCSGFTMAVYAKYGYYLSHDSNVQSCEGRSVPLSEAQPGDIVVYSGHVAMYIGNGQIVHSPTPGQCVSIASVNMMPVLDVRRIID